MNAAAAKKLLQDIDKKIATNEYNTVTLKGVRNLSRSDLETIKLYAETYLKSGCFDGLMKPLGEVREVLDKYGVLEG